MTQNGNNWNVDHQASPSMPGDTPFEQTEAFRIVGIHARIAECDKLLERAKALKSLKTELQTAQRALVQAEQALDGKYREESRKASEAYEGELAQLAQAEQHLTVSQQAYRDAQEQIGRLGHGGLTVEDQAYVDQQIDDGTTERRKALSILEEQVQQRQENVSSLQGQSDKLFQKLSQERAELPAFSDRDVPETYANNHRGAMDKTATRLDSEIEAIEAAQQNAKTRKNTLEQQLARLKNRLDGARSNKANLDRQLTQGFFSRLGSATWWESFVTDYADLAKKVQLEIYATNKDMAEVSESVESLHEQCETLKRDRGARLDEARKESASRLKALCKERINQLLNERAKLEESLSEECKVIQSLELNLKSRLSDLNSAIAISRERALEHLAAAASESLSQCEDESREAEAKHKETQASVERMVVDIASQKKTHQEQKIESLRPHAERINEVQQLLAAETAGLQQEMSAHRVHCSNDDYTTAICAAQNEASRELEQLSRDDQPETRGGVPVDVINEEVGDTAATPQSTGSLYLDFSKNEDDNQDNRGRTFYGLRTQLQSIKRQHKDAFFPQLGPDEDICSAFIDAMFSEGLVQSYFISNLSLRDQPFLALRPKLIGPRLERLIPRGMSLSICGKLWDNNRDPENPVLLVQRIVDISHSPARSFEQKISGTVYTQQQHVYPAFQRQSNILSTDFIQRLPSISIETRSRLEDWRSYLDWKERLVHARLVGLRYVSIDVQPDGRVRFLTVSSSKKAFEDLRRMLQNGDIYAYGLGYSQDPWEFEYNGSHRGRGAELGDFAGQEPLSQVPNAELDGLPWDDSYFAHVFFRLPEDEQNEFDAVVNSGGKTDDAARQYLQSTNPQGFLAQSVVGDIALVDRQRRELKQLQEQSGYAPFLSSYLFDIAAANEPQSLVEIEENEWSQPQLNNDQRLAVRKMVSTPDLAMVQGPPGTGKTTMIAEATWQFVNQDKKVLLVSQASLAVNNALERLPQIPAIRAIRLSRRERKNEGEHPYSQAQAIGTFYRSISQACSKRTLQVWSRADERRDALASWLSNVGLIEADLKALREKRETLGTELRGVNKELDECRNARDQAAESKQNHRDIESMAAFLEGADTFTGVVPFEFLDEFYTSVVVLLDELRSVDIQVNSLWSGMNYGSQADRSRFLREILFNWRSVRDVRAQLFGDIERLKGSSGDTVMSPELAARLDALKRQLDETQAAMIEDGSKVNEWQAIQREMQELRRSESGLNRDLYAGVFNVPDNHSLKVLVNSRSAKDEVLQILENAIAELDQITPCIEVSLERLAQSIRDAADQIVHPDFDDGAIRRLEGRSRELEVRRGEIAVQENHKAQRLNELRQMCPSDDRMVSDESIELPVLVKAVAREHDEIRSRIATNKPFSEAWGPVLTNWVKDLQDKQTIRSDQDNFIDTYVASCNVVGVTCTERRQTLEDASHSWFDAVIVDEVSKATPTEILMPLMMGRTAILVGDHRQLPPLFKEHEGSWEEAVADQEEIDEKERDPSSELTSENFERFKKMVTSSLFKEHFENAPDSLKSFLFTQYRMHPQIMRVVNQFYENRLTCGLSDPDAKVPDSDPRGHRVHNLTLPGNKSMSYVTPDHHVAWIDSTRDPQGRPHHERRDLGTSKVNELECMLIARALCDLENACREQGHGTGGRPRKQVGVVTFYGRQVRSIREAIRRAQKLYQLSDFKAITYDINTVDRYQGQERQIILVSMVRNPPFRLSQRANTAQFERINVAFSRAQELLVVAGAKDVFSKYPVMLPHLDKPGKRRVEVYRHILDEIQRCGGLWSSGDVLSSSDYDRLLPPNFEPQGGRSNKRGGRRQR